MTKDKLIIIIKIHIKMSKKIIIDIINIKGTRRYRKIQSTI